MIFTMHHFIIFPTFLHCFFDGVIQLLFVEWNSPQWLQRIVSHCFRIPNNTPPTNNNETFKKKQWGEYTYIIIYICVYVYIYIYLFKWNPNIPQPCFLIFFGFLASVMATGSAMSLERYDHCAALCMRGIKARGMAWFTWKILEDMFWKYENYENQNTSSN